MSVDNEKLIVNSIHKHSDELIKAMKIYYSDFNGRSYFFIKNKIKKEFDKGLIK